LWYNKKRLADLEAAMHIERNRYTGIMSVFFYYEDDEHYFHFLVGIVRLARRYDLHKTADYFQSKLQSYTPMGMSDVSIISFLPFGRYRTIAHKLLREQMTRVT
jgi:hypothetical protein